MPEDISPPVQDPTELDFDSAIDSAFGSIANDLNAATAPATTAPPEPPSAPEPAAAGTPAAQEPPPTDENILEGLFVDRFGDGFAAKGKYKTTDALMDGINEAFREMGRRNEDALLGRQFRENPQAFLQQYGWTQTQQTAQQVATQDQQAAGGGQQPPQPVGQPAAYQPGSSWKEVQRLKGLIRSNPETGALEPKPGAPPDVVERYEEHQHRAMQTLFDLANNPQQFLQQAAQHAAQVASQQATQYVQQQFALAQQHQAQQQQFHSAVAEGGQWVQGHLKELFNDGDPSRGMTALGAATDQVFEQRFKGLVNEGRMTPAMALEASRAIVLANVPPPQPVQPPSPQAQHRPNVANAPGAAPDKWAQRPNEDIDAYTDRLFGMVARGETPPGTPQ